MYNPDYYDVPDYPDNPGRVILDCEGGHLEDNGKNMANHRITLIRHGYYGERFWHTITNGTTRIRFYSSKLKGKNIFKLFNNYL